MMAYYRASLLHTGGLGFLLDDPPESRCHGEVGEAGWSHQIDVPEGEAHRTCLDVLRHRPRHLAVGNLRDDGDVALALLRASGPASTATTMDASDVISALKRLADMVASALGDRATAQELMGRSLRGVIVVSTDEVEGQTIMTPTGVLFNSRPEVRQKLVTGQFEALQGQMTEQLNYLSAAEGQ
jgi:Tfp pilus assembly pilus retraction ATPase PilT